MAWWTEKDALNEQIRLLRKEIKAKDEQIVEMQLLIDKANEKLKVHFSDVVRPLPEFLYESEGRIHIGFQSGSDVTDEWEKWKAMSSQRACKKAANKIP